MANARLIYRDFFTSGDLEDLGAKAKLLFAGLIVYADDSGVIRHQVRFYRNTILHGERTSYAWIEHVLCTLSARGVLVECNPEGVKCWRIKNFARFQRLKRREGKRREAIAPHSGLRESPVDSEPDHPEPVDWDAQLRCWNDLAVRHGRPQVRSLTASRKAKLRARLKEHPDLWAKVDTAIDRAGDFARAGAWLSFDWLLSASNLAKLLEGNYDREREAKPGASSEDALREAAKARRARETLNEYLAPVLDAADPADVARLIAARTNRTAAPSPQA